MPNFTYQISDVLAHFGIQISPINSIGLVNDSRTVSAGDVFCAVIGSTSDGRQYIDKAIAQGAVLVISQCQHSQQHGKRSYKTVVTNGVESTVTVVQFYHLNEHLYELANRYYQMPEQAMKMIGITGTNGKTSTSNIICQLLGAAPTPHKAAVIGTVGAGLLNNLTPIANTTPGATELMALLADFRQQEVAYVAMEASSHALEQKRVVAELFDIAVFTNLTRDHLDYHETMENYAAAKFSIFTKDDTQIAILNGEAPYAKAWLADNTCQAIVYGKTAEVSTYSQYVYADAINFQPSGVSFNLVSHLGEIAIQSPLLGAFNIDNLLAALATLVALKFSLAEIAERVMALKTTIGRMETFSTPGKPLAIVDYAHTPDGLLNALNACRAHNQGKLWLVFGCGGDRDKGKRPEMGAIAEQYADHVIITNDNPRTEAPEMIVSDILAGCQHSEKIRIVLDRKQAVQSALTHASADDIVLLAGKGHEDYTIMGTEKIAYNEREFVKSFYPEVSL